MFGSIGGAEILIILVLALLLFGPRSLPRVGRTVGRALSEFRKATHDFKSTLEREVELDQVKEATDGLREAGREVTRAVDDARRFGVSRGSLRDGEAVNDVTDSTEATDDSSTETPGDVAEERKP